MSNHTTLSAKEIMQAVNNSGNTGVFATVSDPIAEEIRNPANEKAYLHQMPVIPFMGKGDVTLPLLTRMSKLSPTHAAAIKSIRNYVMGGQFEVVRKKVPGFARRQSANEEVSDADFAKYTEWLTSWIDGQALMKVLKKVYDNFSKYGNAYIEVVFTEVLGKKQIGIYSHDADRCLYLATLEGMDKVMLISPYWYKSGNYNEVPSALPLYPKFSDDGAGTKRTMIHLKNEVSGREWYGEPSWLAALYYVFQEMQAGQYNVEGYNSNFTGELFIETYEGFGHGLGGEPSLAPTVDANGAYLSGTQGFYQKLEEFYTNKGKHKRKILHRNASQDSQPTKLHQFAPNTNEKFHETILRLSEIQVLKMHDWNPALMGIQTPGKLGQGNEFATIFKQKFYTVIKPYQDELLDPINQIIRMAADFLEDEGSDIVSEFSLGLKNIHADMLQETDGATKTEASGPKIDEGKTTEEPEN